VKERNLEGLWARYIEPAGHVGPDYWNYFAQRLAGLATIPAGSAVLDVGTYDGNVLLKAMKKAGPRGRGAGIDIYAGGLKDGVTAARESGLGNVGFAQMDAAFLGFRSATYDAVLANFVGWDDFFDFERMKFTAPDSRMAEIMRVLKPGGQVGIGSWIEQCDIDWIAQAFERYLPRCEEATEKGISSYARENPNGYETILRNSGFADIRIHVETTTFVSPDPATWWRQMKQAAGEYFATMPELEQFKEHVFRDLKPFQSAHGIHFDKTVAYAFGIKP
jgi:ubiquinone/menaquinone biosynthesis C-methylase UbiE